MQGRSLTARGQYSNFPMRLHSAHAFFDKGKPECPLTYFPECGIYKDNVGKIFPFAEKARAFSTFLFQESDHRLKFLLL